MATKRGSSDAVRQLGILFNLGPMVLLACRAAHSAAHEAEDAFLVLARRARSPRVRGSLGPRLLRVVRRHGPMVWGVCRHIARTPRDAEGAFRATLTRAGQEGPFGRTSGNGRRLVVRRGGQDRRGGQGDVVAYTRC